MRRFIRFYGANPLHLLAVLLCFALVGYAVMVTGPDAFWNTEVWWAVDRSVVRRRTHRS